ncbi:Zinc finger RING/FYVE/PHD-type protein [Dioscorea alata]|uniref:Zinc finger RING/FYVE/PHD-type protein n=1 Tax=Dioscorea alata TaxID=55571 RepID=A0ACB7USW7_DIOAL|nr:Zinc finger RING/FYVE/PHD-type protein [Dioscorea alata]
MAEKKMSLKLLIDTKANRVLFAEAGKEVVDFLFTLLALPLGSIVKLLSKGRMVGSIGSIYRSLENLDSTYIQPNQDKSILLSPQVREQKLYQNKLLLPAPAPAKVEAYYTCGISSYGSLCSQYVTKASGMQCPSCSRKMDRPLRWLQPESGMASGVGGGEEGLFS